MSRSSPLACILVLAACQGESPLPTAPPLPDADAPLTSAFATEDLLALDPLLLDVRTRIVPSLPTSAETIALDVHLSRVAEALVKREPIAMIAEAEAALRLLARIGADQPRIATADADLAVVSLTLEHLLHPVR